MPEPPRYLVAVCEGKHCVPLGAADDERLAAPATAADFLVRVAAFLRRQGVMGRVVLVDGRSRAVVGARRVWP